MSISEKIARLQNYVQSRRYADDDACVDMDDSYELLTVGDLRAVLTALADMDKAVAERRDSWITAEIDNAIAEERERCARIAEPPLIHRKGKPGLWRQRRVAIAAAIRSTTPGGE